MGNWTKTHNAIGNEILGNPTFGKKNTLATLPTYWRKVKPHIIMNIEFNRDKKYDFNIQKM